MSSIGISRAEALRVAAFVVVYTVFGVILPIQGYLTAGFVLGTVITAVLYGFTLYYLNASIPLGRRTRVLITWAAVYVIQMLNPVLEGVFFSTQFEGHPELIFGAVIFGSVLVFPTALAAGYLFGSSKNVESFRERARSYFAEMGARQFALRFIVASVLWMAIYFVFGSIVGPLVLPYYTDEGVGYHLSLPSLDVLILLQTLRGFIYVLGLLPVILSIKIDKTRFAVLLAALLYVGGALAIFIISDQFPVFLRFVHGIEMFADAVIAGIMISYILGRQNRASGGPV